MNKNYGFLPIMFYNAIKPSEIFDKLDTILLTQRKNKQIVMIPPSSQLMILFIDDVNLPKKEVFGAQPPIEFLRSLYSQKRYFDPKLFKFKKTENL